MGLNPVTILANVERDRFLVETYGDFIRLLDTVGNWRIRGFVHHIDIDFDPNAVVWDTLEQMMGTWFAGRSRELKIDSFRPYRPYITIMDSDYQLSRDLRRTAELIPRGPVVVVKSYGIDKEKEIDPTAFLTETFGVDHNDVQLLEATVEGLETLRSYPGQLIANRRYQRQQLRVLMRNPLWEVYRLVTAISSWKILATYPPQYGQAKGHTWFNVGGLRNIHKIQAQLRNLTHLTYTFEVIGGYITVNDPDKVIANYFARVATILTAPQTLHPNNLHGVDYRRDEADIKDLPR